MQYDRPGGPYFVGDCLPYLHEGVFHFVYLLDRDHHKALNGLGGHQWAHASSVDLVHWTHHPLAIAIAEPWEASICTGSVFPHAGRFYGFYATRLPDWSEHLSLAVSDDGIHYAKTEPNPFLSPGPAFTKDFRDPHVFRESPDGRFHLLVTTARKADGKGFLAHYTSDDLANWKEAEPWVEGLPGAPECPDTFEWNGWHYLIFSLGGVARYRMARSPLGPWIVPEVETFDGGQARVLKTAGFTGNRRLGAAFLATTPGGYAGDAVFRELVQREDGTLGTRFPPEMIPDAGEPCALSFRSSTGGLVLGAGGVSLAGEGESRAEFSGLPRNARITSLIHPSPQVRAYGLRLGGGEPDRTGVEIRFLPSEREVHVSGGDSLHRVEDLDRPIALGIVLKDDLLDLCIGEARTLVNRVVAERGEGLTLFGEGGEVVFKNFSVRPLL